MYRMDCEDGTKVIFNSWSEVIADSRFAVAVVFQRVRGIGWVAI